MINADVDISRWESQVGIFSREVRRPTGEVLREQTRLVTRDLAKLTPPIKALSALEPWAEQRRIGEAAVARDIGSAFIPLEQFPDAFVKNESLRDNLRTAAAKGDTSAVRALLAILKVQTTRLIPEPTTALHNVLRDRRGRVRRVRSPFIVERRGAIERFVRAKQKLVGRAKAGWAAAAARLGVALPAWIRRHVQQGQIADRSDRDRDPEIILRNTVPYAQRLENDVRFVRIAFRNAAGKLERQLRAKAEGLWQSARRRAKGRRVA